MLRSIKFLIFLIPLTANSQIRESKCGKYIIKTEPLNIRFNHISLGFEKYLNKRNSINFIVGYIGIGEQPSDEIMVNGAYTRLGLKFFMGKKNYPSGFYNNPELCFGYQGNSYYLSLPNANSSRHENKFFLTEKYIFGIMNNFGYQMAIIKNRILLDVYIGFGSTFESYENKENYYYTDRDFFVSKFGFNTRLTTNLGFNIGYIFGKR